MHIQKTCENPMKQLILLEHIKCDTYNWSICGELKVIGMILRMQPGHTEYSCFICEWDSRARQYNYIQKDWPLRDELIPAKKVLVTTL